MGDGDGGGGWGPREMRWGERATVLTSSLEGLGARGAAVAVGEGGGCWAQTPGTVPGADSSSEVVPVPTSPLPQPPARGTGSTWKLSQESSSLAPLGALSPSLVT